MVNSWQASPIGMITCELIPCQGPRKAEHSTVQYHPVPVPASMWTCASNLPSIKASCVFTSVLPSTLLLFFFSSIWLCYISLALVCAQIWVTKLPCKSLHPLSPFTATVNCTTVPEKLLLLYALCNEIHISINFAQNLFFRIKTNQFPVNQQFSCMNRCITFI